MVQSSQLLLHGQILYILRLTRPKSIVKAAQVVQGRLYTVSVRALDRYEHLPPLTNQGSVAP